MSLIAHHTESERVDRAATRRPLDSQPTTEVSCAHCGLPVPAESVKDPEEPQFCCSGCCAVWNLLSGSGLQQYYSFLDQLNERAKPALSLSETAQTQRVSEFDTAQFEELYCDDLG